jgi:hypothetical protein
MTQKEYKDLLLKDICARLPYGLKGKCVDASYDTFCEMIFQTPKFDVVLEGIKGDLLFVTPLIEDKDEQEFANEEVADGIDILDFKPYLRPMSSMTEEEKKDLLITIVGNEGIKYFQVLSDGSIDNTDETIQDLNKFNMHWVNFDKDTVTLYLDWLNRHHIDYRGLIPMSLAIAVTEENNPYKD